MFVLIAGSLSVAVLLVALLSWRFYRSFSIPGDIMFAICLSELVENSSMVASAIYFKMYGGDPMPSNFEPTCITIGIFYTIGNTSSLIYNLIFCLIVSTSLKKTLKGSLFSQAKYHTITLVAVAAITASLAATKTVGSGFNGVCGYKISNRESISRFIIELLICMICFASMIQFKNKIPKNEYFKKVAVFGFYYYYMGIFTFVQVFATVAYMVGNIACRSGYDYPSNLVTFSILSSTIFTILLSYFISLLRMSHPIVKMKFVNFFKPNRIKYSDQ